MTEKGWTQELPEYQPLDLKIDHFMWKNTYIGVLTEMVQEVQSQGNLEKARSCFAQIGAEEFYGWFNGLIKKDAEYIYSFNSIIYPDQNGELHFLSDLQRDKIIHEELKGIAEGFVGFDKDCSVYSILLDKGVEVDHTYVHACSDMDVARKISTAITTLLSQQDLSSADLSYQESCTRLLAWIQEHYEEAACLFPAFWKDEDQMKLLTAKAAVRIQKKANAYEGLMSELGTDDPDEAIEKIIQMRTAAMAALESDSGQDSGICFDEDSRWHLLQSAKRHIMY